MSTSKKPKRTQAPEYSEALKEELEKSGRTEDFVRMAEGGPGNVPPERMLRADMVGNDPFFLSEQYRAAMKVRQAREKKARRRPAK